MTDDPDWEAAAAFLAAPGTLGPAPEVIETHTARVFLAGDRAWKLRKPVDYGWLDYGTRARRRAMARREIDWNAPHAPGLYLGLGGVAPGPRLVGPAEEVPETAEPLVVMARFPGDALFDRMAAAGRLDAGLMAETGRAAAALHRAAEPGDAPDLAALVGREVEDLTGLSGTLGEARIRDLAGRLGAEARARAETAATRRERLCHGDLHLGNIVLWQGAPAPFDRIEFNEDIARVDPLYDIAFLAMDLGHREMERLVPALLSAWAEAMASEPGADPETAYGGFALLPLYRALRAAIRAKVAVLGKGGEAAPEARDYLALAEAALAPREAPRLIAVGGFSGSGKSVLARGLAAETGALVIRSDAVRKGLAGVAPSDRLPPESYTAEAAARTYAAMADRARSALAGGMSVILDAAHLTPEERAEAARVADAAGVAFTGLWLDAPAERLAARTAAREGDVSDATPAVVEHQLSHDPGSIDWHRLDAAAAPEEVLAAARARL